MTVSLALTKGRLERKTVDMLERSGYGIEPLRNQGRQLVFEDTRKDLKYFLVKSNDCLTYVMHGVADAGVVGKDTILEGPKDYYEVLDLKIGVCKFIVAALPETDLFNRDGHVRIGTKYPNVATKYFNDRGMDVEIIKIDGSVELSPLLGLCDGIVDIMETGTTLKENGLVVLDDVAPVSARLIVNKAAFRTKKQEILELVRDLSLEVDREQAMKKEKDRKGEYTCSGELNAADLESLTAWLKSRTQTISGDIYKAAADIIDQVRQTGDQALRDLALKFDHRSIRTLKLTQEQIDELASQADPAFVQALQGARDNILAFHQAQKTNSFILTRDNGVYLGQRVLPLDAVGIYVPGGRAQYPSSVLMNAIPAKVAGVKRIVMMTPPAENGLIEPAIACAAKLAGVTEIYVTGGAQAIAAMAYGTETIAPVDKIVGPGNAFVAAAKKLVFGTVDIDMIAGPSEILVIADAGADPAWIAADLLSQAEHDPLASAMLVTTEQTVIDQVNRELVRQLETLPKKDIAAASLADYGRSILCSSMEKCLQVANRIAPEHLELMVENPMNWLGQVRHAGSVFLGYSTCESIGDYYGGTNHVLPTSGTAKFSSALGVDAFVKRSSFLHYSPEQLEQDAEAIMTLAQAEHLQAHANAAAIRVAADRQKGGQ